MPTAEELENMLRSSETLAEISREEIELLWQKINTMTDVEIIETVRLLTVELACRLTGQSPSFEGFKFGLKRVFELMMESIN